MHKREEWVMTVQERERLLDILENVRLMARYGIGGLDGKKESEMVFYNMQEMLQILHGEWTPKTK
jgi:hypothetical protein